MKLWYVGRKGAWLEPIEWESLIVGSVFWRDGRVLPIEGEGEHLVPVQVPGRGLVLRRVAADNAHGRCLARMVVVYERDKRPEHLLPDALPGVTILAQGTGWAGTRALGWYLEALAIVEEGASVALIGGNRPVMVTWTGRVWQYPPRPKRQRRRRAAEDKGAGQ
jgi:hypothetical protein